MCVCVCERERGRTPRPPAEDSLTGEVEARPEGAVSSDGGQGPAHTIVKRIPNKACSQNCLPCEISSLNCLTYAKLSSSDVWQVDLKNGKHLLAGEVEARPEGAASSDGGQGPAKREQLTKV